jgi:O-Antigen ligase
MTLAPQAGWAGGHGDDGRHPAGDWDDESTGAHRTVSLGRPGVRPHGTARTPIRIEAPAPPTAAAGLRPWPLVGLLLLYPVWWALGLGVIIFPLFAVPMAYMLLRSRLLTRVPIRLPPGFGWWILFLITVVVSVGMLGINPPGTVAATAGSRMLAVGFRFVEYVSLTILMVFAGNLTEAQVSRRRLVGLMSWLFGVTVAGGFLGMVAGNFQFDSPIELLLPGRWRSNSFVQSLVHPAAAQMMDVLGHPSPRPAAPWGYTNTWGNNFCLLAVWFIVAAYGYAGARRINRLAATGLLVVSVAPVVYSLNRGLWIGLGVCLAYVVLRFVSVGRVWVIGVLTALLVLLAVTLMVTPLGNVVTSRLDNGKSNGVRMYLTDHALAGLGSSPIIGYGSTRNTQGGRNSITVGSSDDCPHCGNFTIGGNGQLWQVLYAHGLVGTLTYFGFFLYGLWRFRRDRTAIGLAGSTAIVGSLVAALWYNSLVTPLAFTFLAYALLWRNEIDGGARHTSEAPVR